MEQLLPQTLKGIYDFLGLSGVAHDEILVNLTFRLLVLWLLQHVIRIHFNITGYSYETTGSHNRPIITEALGRR